MGMWNNLLARFTGKREYKKLERWQLETADATQWIMPDPYIYAQMADFYRLSPSLGAALDKMAMDIGNTKFNVKRRKGEELVDIPNHEFELLLESPNPKDTGAELIGYTVRDYILNGNAVWWLNRKSWAEAPREMWYIPFHRIKPIPDGRMYLSHYEYSPGNGKPAIKLPTWQIVHFRNYNPFNDFVGLSPIESLADILAGDIGMRKSNRQRYVQMNGEPPSILAFKDYVPDDAWADIKAKIEEASRENKMLRLRGVGDAVSWMSRAMTNRDSQFIELLRQNTIDIFNRVCPGAMAMLESGANRSTADAARATYTDTIWGYMQVIARKVTKEILYAYSWGEKLRGEFDDPRFVDRQLELMEIDTFAKTHTVDEVRQEKYGDDPIGDERGDLLVVQITSGTGKVQEEPVPPEQPQPMTEGQDDETMDTPEDEAQKAAVADLLKWRRMVAGGKTQKAAAFTSAHIPAGMARSIKARLPSMEKADAVAMFDRHISSFKRKPSGNALDVLRGLELTVKALESRSK